MNIMRQGLEYTAVEAVMRMHDIADPATCLDQVQLIERGALEIFNQQ